MVYRLLQWFYRSMLKKHVSYIRFTMYAERFWNMFIYMKYLLFALTMVFDNIYLCLLSVERPKNAIMFMKISIIYMKINMKKKCIITYIENHKLSGLLKMTCILYILNNIERNPTKTLTQYFVTATAAARSLTKSLVVSIADPVQTESTDCESCCYMLWTVVSWDDIYYNHHIVKLTSENIYNLILKGHVVHAV